MNDIEERLFNATEGKWYRNNNKIVVVLPEISLVPIVIAEFPEDTI